MDGSGTTAMPYGPFNPETSEELMVAPVMALYSPILPFVLLMTKRLPPYSAMPAGLLNPEMSEELIVAPVMALYSPIVPAE